MKALCFAMACLAIAGCSGTGPAPVQRTAAEDPTAACLVGLDKHAALTVLKPRLASVADAEAAPPALRTSMATPTPDERRAIQAWAGLRKDCVNAGAEFRLRNAPPAYADLVEEENSRTTVLLSRLYVGEIGYGEFINERIALGSEMKGRRPNAREPHQRANAPIRQEEAAQRKAELSAALVLLQLPQ